MWDSTFFGETLFPDVASQAVKLFENSTFGLETLFSKAVFDEKFTSRSTELWTAMSAGFSLTEKVDTAISTALVAYDSAQILTVAIAKIFLFFLLLRHASWKFACAFWLLSNILGTGFVYRFFFRAFWFLLNYLVIDGWLSSSLILSLWLLDELNLVNLPLLARKSWSMLTSFLHKYLDVTGDGQFDYKDVEEIARRAAKRLSSPSRKASSNCAEDICPQKVPSEGQLRRRSCDETAF